MSPTSSLRRMATRADVQRIANAQRIKPQLACLDALGKIPDTTNPPAGVQIYFVNFEQKQLLSP